MTSPATTANLGHLVSIGRNVALAAMVGDAIGAAFEGHGPEHVAKAAGSPLGARSLVKETPMGVPTKLPGWNVGPRSGAYTDDTNAAVALTRALIMGSETERCVTVDGKLCQYWHARQWLDGFTDNFFRGCPGSAQQVMLATMAGKDAKESATISFPDSSFANGAAMKIWPLPLLFVAAPADQLYDATKIACAFSHAHPQAFDGAAVLATATRWAMLNNDVKSFDGNALLNVAISTSRVDDNKLRLESLQKLLQSAPPPSADVSRSPDAFAAEVELLRERILLPILGKKELGFQISTYAGIVCVFAIVARHGGRVSDVIALSIGIGGDTDTIASMAGALSAACAPAAPPVGGGVCSAEVFAALENGEFGRDFILNSAERLVKMSVEFSTAAESKSVKLIGAVGDARRLPITQRTAADIVAELCGLFWANFFIPLDRPENMARLKSAYASLQRDVFQALLTWFHQAAEVTITQEFVDKVLLRRMHGPLRAGAAAAAAPESSGSSDDKKLKLEFDQFVELTKLP